MNRFPVDPFAVAATLRRCGDAIENLAGGCTDDSREAQRMATLVLTYAQIEPTPVAPSGWSADEIAAASRIAGVAITAREPAANDDVCAAFVDAVLAVAAAANTDGACGGAQSSETRALITRVFDPHSAALDEAETWGRASADPIDRLPGVGA